MQERMSATGRGKERGNTVCYVLCARLRRMWRLLYAYLQYTFSLQQSTSVHRKSKTCPT
jgi:hypothetical protein